MKDPAVSGPLPRFAGRPAALDGHAAVAAAEAAIAGTPGPATPADGWTAAVSAGRSLSGLRAALTAGRRLSALHESLHADAGRRLTYVLNVESRAAAKHTETAGASHDDYHAVDDAGLFQLFAHDVQSAADLGVIAHRLAELSLTPGLVARDTGGAVQSLRVPERALIEAYLGDPSDLIESPTPAQKLVYGDRRRRIPEHFDADYPAMLGAAQSPEDYAQGVAAQRPFYLDHVAGLADRAFEEFAALTGRAYARAGGRWLDDAEYLVIAQGGIVPMAEAVCDHLRRSRWIRVGVLNLTMFRPFPGDLISALVAGRKAVTVMERVDQPLAADPPLLREIRATMFKALENGRARKQAPHPGIAACRAADLPAFFSACFGLGGKSVHSGDLVAAIENMTAASAGRRHFYLGIDFARPGTRFPKQQVWQEQVADRYPDLATLALPPAPAIPVLPKDAIALRLHGLTSPDAMRAAASALAAAATVFELQVQASARAATSAGGRLDACLARDPVRVMPELEQVTVSLAAGPGAFSRYDPLDGLTAQGALVLETGGDLRGTWGRIPAAARKKILEGRRRVYGLDVSVVPVPADDKETRDRMTEAALLGAGCRISGLAGPSGALEPAVVRSLTERLTIELGEGAQPYVSAFAAGFSSVTELAEPRPTDSTVPPAGRLPVMPASLGAANVKPGIAHGGRFWEQVGALSTLGLGSIADPFAALGAIPAATSAIRDMTAVRTTVPQFVADRCTGCGACWVQCPDAAIPGVVSDVADVIAAAITTVEADRRCDRLRQVVKPLASEIRRQLKSEPFTTFPAIAAAAYATVADKLGLDDARRRELDEQFGAVHAMLLDFPAAKTAAFFDSPEARAKGTGGLLSVTVNPEACKGCRICVDACEPGALVAVPQTDTVVETLRRNWALWQNLPETPDRYVDGGENPVAALLLKQGVYQSMSGGGDLTPGAAEKTALHLVLSSVNAFVMPRAARHVERLTELIEGLDHKARELLASDAAVHDADALSATADGKVAVQIAKPKREHLEWIARIIRELTDLRWRYTEGPGGKGRATCGMASDGSPAWSSTYPYNPYPFPWASRLLEDAPALAAGIFEGQMQKMARGFSWVRRAELELAGDYDAAVHEPALAGLAWREFTDEEFALCPPILAVGGTSAMLDAGGEHLSRLLASDIPVRVVMLDALDTPGDPLTQARRDVALVGIAHRRAFVLQSSPAAPSHLVSGVLRGLAARRPALFVISCPPAARRSGEPGSVARALKLAFESRAMPVFLYDPAAGPSISERLTLDGNPAPEQPWPTYELPCVDEAGAGQVMTLPVTVADWAATEPAWRHCFTEPGTEATDAELMRFDEYVASPPDARAGKTPFIYVLGEGGRLARRLVASEVVQLSEERLELWRYLRQLAGHDLPDLVRERIVAPVEREHERRRQEIDAQHQARVAELETRYPALVARRLAEGLLRAAGDGTMTVADLLGRAASASGIAPVRMPADGNGDASVASTHAAAPASPAAAPTAPAPPRADPVDAAEDDAESLTMDPYIQSELCTSCDECININKRMFAYDKKKQAYIKDAKAGTFRQLVMAAEKCPVKIIHPGTPLNPDEPDLARWVQQAARFQ